MSTVENGSSITVHYVGTFEDGTTFDNSRDRGEPLAFEVGSGNMIKGFSDACVGMTAGGTKSVTIHPEHAYGDVDPNAVGTIPRSQFPNDFEPVVGATVLGQNDLGQKMMATIKSHDENSVELDFNHPLAGKVINFDIELLSVS
jgi:peptidylprolyl isomerase